MKTNQTKPIRDSMFSVQCWMLKVALALLLATAGSALAEVHYVDVNSTNATPPYTNWTTGAVTIQDAVDAAAAGDEVIVTNGIYAIGGTNGGSRVEVEKPLNIRSVNGPQSTVIRGSGIGGMRCVRLTSGASLSGFNLAGGNAVTDGGGALGGTLNNCTLTGNSAFLGGGGAFGCTLNNCALTGNKSGHTVIQGSNPNAYGGGAADCALNNCTLTGNSASDTYDFNFLQPYGGGATRCTLNNCIVYLNSNTASYGANYDGSSFLNYCCTTPQPPNGVNITSAPLFVDEVSGNLRLHSNSPCINAGNNSHVTNTTDLDGNPRIAGGTVDIGAYEFQATASMISYAWLQHFNLPINPATDTADPDGDGVNNYHEWLAGTNPTNPLSSPAQLNIIPSGTSVILTWSTNAVGFTLQSTANLGSAVWSTNSPAPVVIAGQNTVTNPITGPQGFYRLIH